ncbi:MAG: AAA family ATPase [Sedimentisphaerales bacterium]|nr:AAA family ATPase [Sedimentisphaerales bacterium]
MSILDCQGQQSAVLRLQRALRGRRVPHSYIFYGPEGVGKSLLARQWAKLLLCPKPVRRPLTTMKDAGAADHNLDEIDDCCDQCRDCRMVEAGTHPDLHIINRDLARFTSLKRARQLINLPIDVIREFVIKPAGIVPTRGRARIFIIEESETMSQASQNALLKTLEEPPPGTFLILITSRPERFLPTVQSRCQSVRFGPLPYTFIHKRLTATGVPAEQVRYWADFCNGRLGPALELAQLNLYEKKCQLIRQLAGLNYYSALDVAAWIVDQAKEFARSYQKQRQEPSTDDTKKPGPTKKKGGRSRESGQPLTSPTRLGQTYFLQMLSHAFSEALRFHGQQEQGKPQSVNPESARQIAQIAQKYSPWACAKAVRATAHTEGLLQANVNPSLLFESLMIEYLRVES